MTQFMEYCETEKQFQEKISSARQRVCNQVAKYSHVRNPLFS